MEAPVPDESPTTPKAHSQEALSPLLAAALGTASGTLRERLSSISEHSPRAGRYRMLGEIARGGMGRVMRVWDDDLQRELAMKTVGVDAPDGSSDEERLDHDRRLVRFLDEARITGQLGHPGIVPVHEIALDEDGRLFFTMPLVRGATYSEVIDRVHRQEVGWNLARAVRILHTVCLTVAFAHDKGVVHRDLKPDNVMVGPFGEAYVVDWGLALVLGRDEPRTVVGTPAFMAPEQAEEGSVEVGPTADVYSLGAILYQLLSARMPHELSVVGADGHGDWAALAARPPRPLEPGENRPAELVAICRRAMAVRPQDRYPSAEALSLDLAAWMEGRVVSVHPAGPMTRLRKWRSRNRPLAMALEALVVLSLFSGAGFLWLQRSKLQEVRAERKLARERGYVAHLAAAELGLRAHEAGSARRYLAQARPELRGWEWHHLHLRTDSAVRVLEGHGDAVGVVAFDSDGGRIATGADDGGVRLWSVEGGLERTLEAHHGQIRDLAFDPGGKLLATAAEDERLRVWDLATGTLDRELGSDDDEFVALAYLGPGWLVGLNWDGELQAFGGRPEARGRFGVDAGPATDLVAAQGRLWVSYASGELRAFDAETHELVEERPLASRKLTRLVADAGRSRLAAASGEDVWILEVGSTEAPRLLRVDEPVESLAFSPEGERLCTVGFDNVVRIWDLEEDEVVLELDGHDHDVRAVAFHPDGERLVTGSEDETARLWHARRGATQTLAGHRFWATRLAFDPRGELLVSTGRDGRVLVWDADSGRPRGSLEVGGVLDDLTFDPAGRLAVAGGPPGLSAGDVHGLTPLGALRAEPRRLVFAGSGTLLVQTHEGDVVALEPGGGERYRVEGDTELSWALAVHPRGETFARGRADGSVELRRSADGRLVERFPGKGAAVTDLAFSPDGERLAAATDGRTLYILDLTSGERQELQGHENRTSCVAFHPDGTRLVSGSFDRTVRLWDAQTGEALLSLRGHVGPVTSLAFSPGGETLASSSKDGTVRLWRTRPPN